MGLAFSTRTIDLIADLGKGLISINPATDKGDALVLDRDLFSTGTELEGPASDTGPVFPPDWEEPRWISSRESSPDYAIVLRHIKQDGEEKSIEFVLAGFTEDGTAAAGEYLAANWRTLNRLYVESKPQDTGQFFLLFIVFKNGKWQDSRQINPITRETLDRIIQNRRS